MGQLFLVHVDLFVASMERSLKFYRDALGAQVIEDFVVDGSLPQYLSGGRSRLMRLVLLRLSTIGAAIELVELVDSGEALPAQKLASESPRANISLLVEDVRQLETELGKLGILPVSTVYPVALPRIGDSRIIFYRDPDGHLIEFIERSSAKHRS